MVRISDQMVMRPYLPSLVHKAISGMKGVLAAKGELFNYLTAAQARHVAKPVPGKHHFDITITQFFQQFAEIDNHCTKFDAAQFTKTRTEVMALLNTTKVSDMKAVPS